VTPVSRRDSNGSNGMPEKLQVKQCARGLECTRAPSEAREGVGTRGRFSQRQQLGVVVAVGSWPSLDFFVVSRFFVAGRDLIGP
jgi:hypothetical protein